jgi:hypothetical protein
VTKREGSPILFDSLPLGPERDEFTAALDRVWEMGSTAETRTVSAEYSWLPDTHASPIQKIGLLAVHSTYVPPTGIAEVRTVIPSTLKVTAWQGGEPTEFVAGVKPSDEPSVAAARSRTSMAIKAMPGENRKWWGEAWEQVQAVEANFIDFSAGRIIDTSPHPTRRHVRHEVAREFGDGTHIAGTSEEVVVLYRGRQIPSGSSCRREVTLHSGTGDPLRYTQGLDGTFSMSFGTIEIGLHRAECERAWMSEFSRRVGAAVSSGFASAKPQ